MGELIELFAEAIAVEPLDGLHDSSVQGLTPSLVRAGLHPPPERLERGGEDLDSLPAAEAHLAALATRGHRVSYGQATGALEPMSPAEKSGTFSQPVLFHYTAESLLPMAGRVFAALRDGVLRPDVRRRYPLAAAADAHRDLEARRISGQIVPLAQSWPIRVPECYGAVEETISYRLER
jgi:zinc-binding alcohol dehydrogenase family protein